MTDLTIKSEPIQNYLKAIYSVTHGEHGASQVDIANQVGVTPSGVSKMLRQMERQGLISYEPYRPVHLTDLGLKIALEIIRHHRLLEVYLIESLGYSWEQVHQEAERLEHHISEDFEDTIDRLLGYPQFDPHGDPIPTREGYVAPVIRVTLESQPVGASVVIRRVTDEDRDLLKYLGERSLKPGTALVLTEREPFGGSLIAKIANHEVRISPEAARHIFVETVETTASTTDS